MTDDPATLQKWLVFGPQITRLLNQFESTVFEKSQSDTNHHNEAKSNQILFQTQVKALDDTLERDGNPLDCQFEELVTLDTRNCLDPLVVETINNRMDNSNIRSIAKMSVFMP